MLVVLAFSEEPAKPDNSNKENVLQERLDSYPSYSEEWFLLKALMFSRTKGIAEKLQIIKEMEELARDCQDTETKARLLHEVGSYYYGVGRAVTEPDIPKIKSYLLQAVESLNKVLELKPTSEKVVFSTLRQLGQLNAGVILDKPEVAVQYYEELERRLTSGTNSLGQKAIEFHLRDVYAKLAPLKDKLGDKDGAMAVHTALAPAGQKRPLTEAALLYTCSYCLKNRAHRKGNEGREEKGPRTSETLCKHLRHLHSVGKDLIALN